MQRIKESYFKYILFYQVLFIFIIIILALLISHSVSVTNILKLDTIVLVFGNFIIALFIAYYINRINKNEELKIDNCFKELDYLLELVAELRLEIQKNPRCDFFEDKLKRSISLIILQIELIKAYDLILEKDKKLLDEKFIELDESLTGENEIQASYALALLQIERRVLNIKSNVL